MTILALVIDHPAASWKVKDMLQRLQAEWLKQHPAPRSAQSPSSSGKEIVDIVLREAPAFVDSNGCRSWVGLCSSDHQPSGYDAGCYIVIA